jgi:hypothetical protein
VLWAALVLSGAACTRDAKPAERRHVDTELGYSFIVRDGWTVDEQAAQSYRQFLARATALDAGLSNLSQRQRELASVLKRGDKNRIVGRLSVFAAKASTADMLNNYLATLGPGQPGGATVEEQQQGFKIGETPYDLARLTIELGPRKLQQEVYVTQVKDEAVMFTLTADDASTLAELKAMMWSTQWAAPSASR